MWEDIVESATTEIEAVGADLRTRLRELLTRTEAEISLGPLGTLTVGEQRTRVFILVLIGVVLGVVVGALALRIVR